MSSNQIDMLTTIYNEERKDPHFTDKLVGALSVKYPEILEELIKYIQTYNKEHHIGDLR